MRIGFLRHRPRILPCVVTKTLKNALDTEAVCRAREHLHGIRKIVCTGHDRALA